MTIEMRPESLQRIIGTPFAEKRLKNREGFAFATDASGELVWQTEGGILDVHAQAAALDAENPSYAITVVEYSCGSLISPQSNLQRGLSPDNL